MGNRSFLNILELVQESLTAFFATLLGGETPVTIEMPREGKREEILQKQAQQILILNKVPSLGFLGLALEADWLTTLSTAMLGEAMTLQDEGVDDLLQELVMQGYESVRRRFVEDDIRLPDASFDLILSGTDLSESQVPEALGLLSIKMVAEGKTYHGFAFMAMPGATTSTPASPAAPAVSTPPEPAMPRPQVAPVSYSDLGGEVFQRSPIARMEGGNRFELLADVEIEVTVELGRRKLPLSEVVNLMNGSVIELDKLVGEPLEIYANGRLIAEGEAVVIEEQFGVRVTRLTATPRPQSKALI